MKSARKHIGWALQELPGGALFRAEMNRIDEADFVGDREQGGGHASERWAGPSERAPPRGAANEVSLGAVI